MLWPFWATIIVGIVSNKIIVRNKIIATACLVLLNKHSVMVFFWLATCMQCIPIFVKSLDYSKSLE